MSADLDPVLTRMAVLENDTRRLKRMVLALMLGFVPLAAMAQVLPRPPRISESRQFTLLDADNRTRASLEIVNNQPILSFYDGRGRTRVRLGLDRTGAPTLTAILPSGRDVELLSEWPKVRPLTDPDVRHRDDERRARCLTSIASSVYSPVE